MGVLGSGLRTRIAESTASVVGSCQSASSACGTVERSPRWRIKSRYAVPGAFAAGWSYWFGFPPPCPSQTFQRSSRL